MNTFPTIADLAELSRRVGDDGFAPHEDAVAEFVALGLDIEPERPSLQVLGDLTAPAPVRIRALVAVGYRWAGIRRRLIERQQQAEQEFDRSHQAARFAA